MGFLYHDFKVISRCMYHTNPLILLGRVAGGWKATAESQHTKREAYVGLLVTKKVALGSIVVVWGKHLGLQKLAEYPHPRVDDAWTVYNNPGEGRLWGYIRNISWFCLRSHLLRGGCRSVALLGATKNQPICNCGSWSCTQLLSPPQRVVPHVMTDPSPRMAAKARFSKIKSLDLLHVLQLLLHRTAVTTRACIAPCDDRPISQGGGKGPS